MNFFAKKMYISIIKILVIFDYKIDFIKRWKIKIEKVKLFQSLLKCVVFDDCIDNVLNFLWIKKSWKVLLKRMTSNIKFNHFVNDNIYQSLCDFVEKLIEHIEKRFRIKELFINVFFNNNVESMIKSTWCFRFLFRKFRFRFRKAESNTFVVEIIANKKSRNAIRIKIKW